MSLHLVLVTKLTIAPNSCPPLESNLLLLPMAQRLIEVQAADLFQLGQQLGEVYGAAIEDGLARVEQFYCVHVLTSPHLTLM